MGDVLILLGLAQITLNIWLALLAPLFALAVFKLAIVPEERHLEERFGDAYLDYKERTRRWF
jgi:protein-S-isoprenylcysteine O-methyltransferase Ste14